MFYTTTSQQGNTVTHETTLSRYACSYHFSRFSARRGVGSIRAFVVTCCVVFVLCICGCVFLFASICSRNPARCCHLRQPRESICTFPCTSTFPFACIAIITIHITHYSYYYSHALPATAASPMARHTLCF